MTAAPPPHSRFGGSVLARVIKCPASVGLSAKAPPEKESAYAAEGTLLHDIAAKALALWIKGKSTDAKLAGMTRGLTPEQRDVIGVYTAAVRTECDLLGLVDATTLLVEERFSLPGLHPEFTGTADAVVYNKHSLRVFDLKCGRGVDVQPTKDGMVNPQLGFYALGALGALGFNVSANGLAPGADSPKIRDVEVVIVQPRLGGVKRHKVLLIELEDLAFDALAAAKLADSANPPIAAGEHCRFCRAAPECPELRREVIRRTKAEFGAPPPAPINMTAEEVSEALTAADMIETWLGAVRQAAFSTLSSGAKIPGYKLVERKGHRTWRDDEAQVLHRLALEGLTRQQVCTSKMGSPAQVEQALKEKGLSRAQILEIMETLVSPGEVTPVLTKDSDKRPDARVGAAADFTSDP